MKITIFNDSPNPPRKSELIYTEIIPNSFILSKHLQIIKGTIQSEWEGKQIVAYNKRSTLLHLRRNLIEAINNDPYANLFLATVFKNGNGIVQPDLIQAKKYLLKTALITKDADQKKSVISLIIDINKQLSKNTNNNNPIYIFDDSVTDDTLQSELNHIIKLYGEYTPIEIEFMNPLSLKTICLHKVANNFSLFANHYKELPDPLPEEMERTVYGCLKK